MLHTHEVTGSSPVVRTRNDRKSKDFRSFSMHILDWIFCYIRVFSPLFQQICNFSETTFYQVRNKFETAFQPVLSEKWSKLLHFCCTCVAPVLHLFDMAILDNVLLTFCCFWYKMHILSKRVISMGHTIFHCLVVPKQLHDRHKEFNDRQWSESSRCGCKIKAFANL